MKSTILEARELKERARAHMFSMGLGDGASDLCRKNMEYGLAKIHYAQEQNGFDPEAYFISTPDETISRNPGRWNAGFGYGGKVRWGNGNEPFVFLEMKPNYCGILVGGLECLPEPSDLIERSHQAKFVEISIDGIALENDFAKSNHFIDIFEVTREKSGDLPGKLPPFIFMIHGSCPELRGDNDHGPGLYINRSETLKEEATRVDTPFGPIHFIEGNDAKEYMDYCRFADSFSKRKREAFASELFDEFDVLANPNHQKLLDFNTMLLGAQDILDPEVAGEAFPVCLRGDLPAYLFRGIPNLDEGTIEKLGFSARATENGLMEELMNANIIPHGGGYKFTEISGVADVLEISTGGTQYRYFACEMENDQGLKIIQDASALEFSYRGKEVIKRTLECGLGEISAKLLPRFVLKF